MSGGTTEQAQVPVVAPTRFALCKAVLQCANCLVRGIVYANSERNFKEGFFVFKC
jgi:hypothetical protein